MSWYFSFFFYFVKTFQGEIIANKVDSAGTTALSTLLSPGEPFPLYPLLNSI